MPHDPHVQRHLRHVVGTLRAAATPVPRHAGRRRDLLDLLDAYAEAGAFPRWDRPVSSRPRRIAPPRTFAGPGARAPRFRDGRGTWCAVGHLVAHTAPDLADALARRFEPCWLHEIGDPRLGAWANANGFSVDELAWIQPGYCWQPPVCDDVVVEQATAPDETTCEGADPRLDAAGHGAQFCQECGGPFQVWAAVQNPGTAQAEVTVELWGPGGVVDRVEAVRVEAGGAVLVPLTTASVEDVGQWGGIRMIAATDCDPSVAELQIWDSGNGGPGWVMPSECTVFDRCGGGRDDDGGCGGCGTTGGPPGWAPLLGLGLLLRRRR